MQRFIAACAVAVLLGPILLFGQSTGRRTRGAKGTASTGAYNMPAVTFQGTVKVITKKELIIGLDSGEESLTFHLSGKTHFVKDGKDIKPAAVTPGTVVAVDATREPDLTFSALTVVVNPPKPKTAQ